MKKTLADQSLGPASKRLIAKNLQSGKYERADDLVHAALTSLRQQQRLAGLKPKELEAIFPDCRKQIAAGLAEAKAGKLSDGQEFFEELDREEKHQLKLKRRSA